MSGFDESGIICGILTALETTLSWEQRLSTEASSGMTGAQWVIQLQKYGICCDDVEEILNSEEFKPTTGRIYNLVIVRRAGLGFPLDLDSPRYSEEKPNLEAACLLLKTLLDDNDSNDIAADHNLVVAHESIKLKDSYHWRLFMNYAKKRMSAVESNMYSPWKPKTSFVFLEGIFDKP